MLNVSSNSFSVSPIIQCSSLFEGVAERNIKACKLQYRNACLYLKIFLNCKGRLEVSFSSSFTKLLFQAESPLILSLSFFNMSDKIYVQEN